MTETQLCLVDLLLEVVHTRSCCPKTDVCTRTTERAGDPFTNCNSGEEHPCGLNTHAGLAAEQSPQLSKLDALDLSVSFGRNQNKNAVSSDPRCLSHVSLNASSEYLGRADAQFPHPPPIKKEKQNN